MSDVTTPLPHEHDFSDWSDPYHVAGYDGVHRRRVCDECGNVQVDTADTFDPAHELVPVLGSPTGDDRKLGAALRALDEGS